MLPYDGETKINWNDVDDHSMLVAPEENDKPMLDLSHLEDARLCTSALLDFIEISAEKYKRFNQIASTSSVPCPQGSQWMTM